MLKSAVKGSVVASEDRNSEDYEIYECSKIRPNHDNIYDTQTHTHICCVCHML